MSAISAASVGVRTMADGTLRLTLDVEPANAKDAFSLFGSPGTPVAIAALKQGYAAKSDEPEQKSPLGPLAKWLVCRCNEPEFWGFLKEEFDLLHPVEDSRQAADIVKSILEVESRKDVDGNKIAETRCAVLLRGPYSRWLARRGVLT
ncbi:MAG TPA: hypothetical protein VMA55_14540 [Acidovorax sp.]|nr:hypothetical protein [Acidovorax sp.]